MKRPGKAAGMAIATVAVAATLAAGAPANAASAPTPGTYKGKLRGGTVSLKVKPNMKGRLTYALKSKCGRAHGTISLKVKRNRFHSTGRRAADRANGRFVSGGKKVRGILTRRTDPRKRAGQSCKAGARRFTASLSSGSGGGGSSLLDSDYGHYAGANATGRPVSFDLVRQAGDPVIENFAVDVDTECWGDYDNNGQSDTLLVHVTGFGDTVNDDGTFDIYFAPDDDTEFEFTGQISGGQVAVDVTVGGHFDSNGTPNLVGAYECDSWGDTYNAVGSG